MERRTLFLASLCLGVLVVNLSAAEPALDATDEHAIQLALRAIKMSEHDLSFSKTNVESELVLRPARTYLQQPLGLPAYAADLLTDLRTVSTLTDLITFATNRLDPAQSASCVPEKPPVPLSTEERLKREERVRASVAWALQQIGDPDSRAKLTGLDASAIRAKWPLAAVAAERIFFAAARAQSLLSQALPANGQPALDALALDALGIDKDTAELPAWEQAGLDTRSTRKLLQRSQALELQDDELPAAALSLSDRFDKRGLIEAARLLAEAVDESVSELRTNGFSGESEVSVDTALGKIIVGGVGRNVYTNEAFLIIDLGGDDIYENSAGGANGLVGRPISIVIDLAGNDQYISKKSFSQGSGVFGIGILVDCGGDDAYEAKHLSQGAGFFGCGLLADYGGHDKFIADTFAQGAAEFGAGILWQRGGDTEYRVAQMGQGFGGTQGVGLLLDESGNDAYYAGGKYACSWLPGRFFSLSQGFGYGMRPFAGGGVGILCDLHGDDHYVADVYGQGASYWYSVGLLLDVEGNDSYQAFQYCQGAGIHLSNGALIDWAGNDTYTGNHISQGAAHDYSVGMLIDRSGNDVYFGDTTAQGSAINNSFAMLLDHAGNDSYNGSDPKQSQAAGHDGEKREYGSIALMLDLAGKDSYSQGQSNNPFG